MRRGSEATLLAVLCAGAAASAAVGQDAGTAAAALRDPARRIAAMQRLAGLGQAAVPALAAALDASASAGDDAGEQQVLLAIGHLGPAAAPLTRALCARLDTTPDATLPTLLWALGRIGPDALGAWPDAAAALAAITTPPGPLRQEYNLAKQRLRSEAPDAERLAAMLARSELVPAAAAAMAVAEHAELHAPLRDAVLAAHGLARDQREQYGDSWQRMVEETALAVLAVAPDGSAATVAWGDLCRYRDPVVRLEAVAALRRDPGAATWAAPALVAALADAERLVVREALLTLAFCSDEALAALPPLTVFAAGDDRELAALARAAKRGIVANLSPIAADVARLLDAAPDDAAAAVQSTAAIGPRAVPFLEALLQSADGELRDRCSAALAAIPR